MLDLDFCCSGSSSSTSSESVGSVSITTSSVKPSSEVVQRTRTILDGVEGTMSVFGSMSCRAWRRSRRDCRGVLGITEIVVVVVAEDGEEKEEGGEEADVMEARGSSTDLTGGGSVTAGPATMSRRWGGSHSETPR